MRTLALFGTIRLVRLIHNPLFVTSSTLEFGNDHKSRTRGERERNRECRIAIGSTANPVGVGAQIVPRQTQQ